MLLCGYAIIKIPFFKNASIGRRLLVAIFGLKIIAGYAYSWFYKLPQYYENADTWRFYRLSLNETTWLLKDPIAFFKDLFVHGYQEPGNIFSGENSYWNDLKSNVIVKIMAVMNVITHNSYYANLVIFNFLFLFGLVAIYRVLSNLYPGKKLLLVAGVFLIPSTLFWCSGIHKDGLILSLTGLIIYCFYFRLKNNRLAFKHWTLIVISLFLIFMLRNYVTLVLVPGLFCWWLSHKYPSKTKWIFIGAYLAGCLLFFAVPYLNQSLNFPGFIVSKQQEFIDLAGGSEINVTQLEPTLLSFIKYLPTAIDMALFRPHLSELKNLSYLPAICEIVLMVLITALYFIFPKRNMKPIPVIWFFFFLSFSILLLAGYTITFSGAIVRYRSFIYPLLFSPLLCMINWEKIIPKRKRSM